jgi:hypothetical protein
MNRWGPCQGISWGGPSRPGHASGRWGLMEDKERLCSDWLGIDSRSVAVKRTPPDHPTGHQHHRRQGWRNAPMTHSRARA